MSDEIQRQYAIRLLGRAKRDIDAAIVHFADSSGYEISQLWRSRLFEEIAKLAVNPQRFPTIPEQKRFKGFGHEFRHLVWKRTASSVAYRIVFWVDEAGDDSPTVFIAYVRHAAAKPITQAEAQGIQRNARDV